MRSPSRVARKSGTASPNGIDASRSRCACFHALAASSGVPVPDNSAKIAASVLAASTKPVFQGARISRASSAWVASRVLMTALGVGDPVILSRYLRAASLQWQAREKNITFLVLIG